MDLDVIELKLDMHVKTFDAGVKESLKDREAYEQKVQDGGSPARGGKFWSLRMRQNKRPDSATRRREEVYKAMSPVMSPIQKPKAPWTRVPDLKLQDQFVFKSRDEARRQSGTMTTLPFPLDASKVIGIPSNVIPALLHPSVQEVIPAEFTIRSPCTRLPTLRARNSRDNTGLLVPTGFSLNGATIAVTYKSETEGYRCICLGELADNAKQGIKYNGRVRAQPQVDTGKHRQLTDDALKKVEGYAITHKIKLSDAALEDTLQQYLKGCLGHRRIEAEGSTEKVDEMFLSYSRLLVIPYTVIRYKVVLGQPQGKPKQEAKSPMMSLIGDKRPKAVPYKPRHTITAYEYTTTWRVPIAHLMKNSERYLKQNHGVLHRLEYNEPVPLHKLLGSCENGACTIEIMCPRNKLPVARHSFTYGYDL